MCKHDEDVSGEDFIPSSGESDQDEKLEVGLQEEKEKYPQRRRRKRKKARSKISNKNSLASVTEDSNIHIVIESLCGKTFDDIRSEIEQKVLDEYMLSNPLYTFKRPTVFVEAEFVKRNDHQFKEDTTGFTLSDVAKRCGYTELIENICLTSLNTQRKKYDARAKENYSNATKKRGRPIKQDSGLDQRQDYYDSQLQKPLQLRKIYDYHSCILTAAKTGTKKIGDCFSIEVLSEKNINLPFHHQFISLFTKTEFEAINSNLSIDIEKAQESISRVTNFYTPNSIISSDETMIACEQRNAPHHLFIPDKPNNTGNLFTSSADKNGVVIEMKLRNRTEEIMLNLPTYKRTSNESNKFSRTHYEKAKSKKVYDLIGDVTTKIAADSTVVADRLYSGIPLLSSLLSRNQHSVLKCRGDRPSWLFKNLSHRILKNKENLTQGDNIVGTCYIPIDGNLRQFFLVLLLKL